MKKLVLTLAIVLCLGMASFAQSGLFGRGAADREDGLTMPSLPGHGSTNNESASELPLGTGALMLIGLGAAYAMTKKNKK